MDQVFDLKLNIEEADGCREEGAGEREGDIARTILLGNVWMWNTTCVFFLYDGYVVCAMWHSFVTINKMSLSVKMCSK